MLNKDYICELLSENAVKSLLFEVSAAPKPGLVDRFNSGAHKDMDFFSFMSSSAALSIYFYKCTLQGVNFGGKSPQKMFDGLRSLGIEAEKRMFLATGGVNTHKGLVFSLGIICAAASNCYVESNDGKFDLQIISEKIKEMTKGISEKELAYSKDIEKMTCGEKIYKRYGLKGIRGEAEGGYNTVLTVSLPVFRELMNSGKFNINDSLVHTLMHIMTASVDTNVIGRHDIESLEYVKRSAKQALEMGGVFTEEGKRYIYKMDKDFIEKNISPGGSADLLAVTVMFYMLEIMRF